MTAQEFNLMKISVSLSYTSDKTEVKAIEILKIRNTTYYYSEEHSVIISQYKDDTRTGCFSAKHLPDYSIYGAEMQPNINEFIFSINEDMKKYIGKSKVFFIPLMKLLIRGGSSSSFGVWYRCNSYEEAASFYKENIKSSK